MGCGRPQQTPASTERIGHEDQEDSASCRLDHAIDSSGEQRRVITSHSKVSEDLRSIIVLKRLSLASSLASPTTPRQRQGSGSYNGIDTSHLLEDHEEDGDDGSVSVARNCPHLLEKRLEGGVSSQASFMFKLIGHFLNLVLYVFGVGRQTIHPLLLDNQTSITACGPDKPYPRSFTRTRVARSQSSRLAHHLGLYQGLVLARLLTPRPLGDLRTFQEKRTCQPSRSYVAVSMRTGRDLWISHVLTRQAELARSKAQCRWPGLGRATGIRS